MNIIIILFLIAFALLAYYREKTEQPNSFKQGYPNKEDTELQLYRKIKYCMEANIKTIKWRRSYISAILVVILLFSIVHFRIPETKELILYVFIIYIVYYMMWHNYTEITSISAAKAGITNLKNLKNLKNKSIA